RLDYLDLFICVPSINGRTIPAVGTEILVRIRRVRGHFTNRPVMPLELPVTVRALTTKETVRIEGEFDFGHWFPPQSYTDSRTVRRYSVPSGLSAISFISVITAPCQARNTGTRT